MRRRTGSDRAALVLRPHLTGAPDRSDLRVLNAVRLGGFADPAVTERAELDSNTTEKALLDLAREGFIERMGFADSRGWILTDAGRGHLASLFAAERAASGAESTLTDAADRFEELNTRFVTLLTRWQLQSPAEQAAHRAPLLRELSEQAEALEHLLADLTHRLPRFARYPRQFTAAVHKARAGEDRWVAGVGILSCHTVWAELHQDLLSSLGAPAARIRT